MKRIFIFLITLLGVKNVSAQYPLTDCIYNTFNHMDSLAKAGKNVNEEWKHCVLDKSIPEFNTRDMSGDSIEMAKLKGSVVVMNFWSINCRPCIAEMPGMNKLVKDYKKSNVVFLAITWETGKRIRKDFLTKYTFDFKIVTDALSIIDQVAASGYPTTYIIDKHGIIKAAWNGGSTGEKAGEEYYVKTKTIIDNLLKAE
jgi:peroxiredoxin